MKILIAPINTHPRLPITYLFFQLLLLLTACHKESELNQLDELLTEAMTRTAKTGELSYYIFPDSDDYTALPNQDPANPITAEKVALGRMLFFETGLAQISKRNNCYETYSCSSCHIPTAGFLPRKNTGYRRWCRRFWKQWRI